MVKPEHACPYDKMECGDKRVEFEIWKAQVEECAKKRINYMIHTSPVQYCPRSPFDDEKRKALCYRYRVWAQQKQDNGR